MPLDPSIKKILLIGAGPIVIGQGCEFDYSGTQACKALREEGCRVILLNSNPATIMTDPQSADVVYIEPITPDTIEKIIIKERPDSLLPTMGGQTALNCTKELADQGILEKYDIRLIGLSLDTIEKAENRKLFKEEMLRIGIDVPRSFSVSSWQEALLAERELNFPLIVRCSFTLGGEGGGVAYTFEELEQPCREGFLFSKELLIEESLLGWKEYELEVMRDRKGNCIVVCGIENVDPMGVHTGDSIAVCPLQTLTDKEYQLMRKKAFQVLEAIKMVSGGCNVQFAVEPQTGRMLCIEVNPRVSRSSALASKATGFPIAKIAAKLALGYNLDELQNEASSFPASFEPTLDYVVVKMPQFNFEKFPQADHHLSTHMKSVGEVMAIGSTFKEALNKAFSSLELFKPPSYPCCRMSDLSTPHYRRIWGVMEALHKGMSVQKIYEATKIDPWFLEQIKELMVEEEDIVKNLFETVCPKKLYRWKQMGFSDERLGDLLNCTEKYIFEKRKQCKIHPVYKRIDTCSGEFPSQIAGMYSTYQEECESKPTTRKKVLVLGSGPTRIGQGIEFDYCCVHAVQAIRELGYESILINCNPETVSTDYDTTDRLYFEPLTLEHVREVLHIEKPLGTLIQLGGQTPLHIGKFLHEEGFPLLGTPFTSIDIAEDRKKFRSFAKSIGLSQPPNTFFSTLEEASEAAKTIGFPMILRPSYIIGGSAIQIIQNETELQTLLQTGLVKIVAPVLMEKFLENALEVEIDALCDGKDIFICGLIEHIDPAGVHSGDSMCFTSPYRIEKRLQEELVEQTRKIGKTLNVVGLFNVQFAIQNNEIFVLEVNARASRTIPILSKTTGLPLVQIATKCIFGQSLNDQGFQDRAEPQFLGLKLPVFPFSRLHLKNEQLGPQMKSTGEVLCLGKSFDELFSKAKVFADQHHNQVEDVLFTNTVTLL